MTEERLAEIRTRLVQREFGQWLFPAARELLQALEDARKALAWYADEENWTQQPTWTPWIGFGEEPDDRQKYPATPAMDADRGARARKALGMHQHDKTGGGDERD